jgi:hypothetical protein
MRLASRRLLGLAAGTLLGLLGPASAARGLAITPNPFEVVPNEFDASHASIELVAVVSGVPTGGTVLNGSVDPTDITLVLRADILDDTTSNLLVFGIRAIGSPTWIPFSGAGWVPGSGVDITSALGGALVGTVAFSPQGGLVSGGQSYDLVFLSYDGPLAADGTLEIVAGVQLVPQAVGTATLVPEPASAVLLGFGTALLGGLGRRRRA